MRYQKGIFFWQCQIFKTSHFHHKIQNKKEKKYHLIICHYVKYSLFHEHKHVKILNFCQIGLVPFVQYFPLSYENCKKSEMNNFLTIFCFKSYHRKRFTERKNLKHFKMGMEIPISSSVLSNKMKTSLQLESGNILNKKAPLAQRILSQILNHFFRCLHALC